MHFHYQLLHRQKSTTWKKMNKSINIDRTYLILQTNQKYWVRVPPQKAEKLFWHFTWDMSTVRVNRKQSENYSSHLCYIYNVQMKVIFPPNKLHFVKWCIKKKKSRSAYAHKENSHADEWLVNWFIMDKLYYFNSHKEKEDV